MKRIALLFAAALAALAILGCSNSRLTRDNYARISNGMSERDVVAILGEPDDDEGGGFAIGDVDASARVMKWDSGGKLVAVTFLGGTVRAKFQKGL